MADYDVPNPAPEPLRQVQLFINSVDLEHGVEWLPDWLRRRRLTGEYERAKALREALRALVLTNSGDVLPAGTTKILDAALGELSLTVDREGALQIRNRGNALDEVVAVTLGAMLDGSWQRLKACRNCRWCFYDYSPNQSATWCSMKLCGNRNKVRTYRQRQHLR